MHLTVQAHALICAMQYMHHIKICRRLYLVGLNPYAAAGSLRQCMLLTGDL